MWKWLDQEPNFWNQRWQEANKLRIKRHTVRWQGAKWSGAGSEMNRGEIIGSKMIGKEMTRRGTYVYPYMSIYMNVWSILVYETLREWLTIDSTVKTFGAGQIIFNISCFGINKQITWVSSKLLRFLQYNKVYIYNKIDSHS